MLQENAWAERGTFLTGKRFNALHSGQTTHPIWPFVGRHPVNPKKFHLTLANTTYCGILFLHHYIALPFANKLHYNN